MKILCYLSVVIICSCSDAGTGQSSQETTVKNINDSTSRMDTNRIPESLLLSEFIPGKYSELSLGVDKDSLSGIYEYYNGWDEASKEYSQINVFYFSGIKTSDSTAIIYAGWPISEDTLGGKLQINKARQLKLVLNGMPDGYANLDFTSENGFQKELSEQKNWMQIRLIKSDKVRLCDTTDLLSVRKGYLRKYDIVKIIDKKNSWVKIEFDNRDLNKAIFGWIKSENLYDLNILKW